jgi:hypothetical protein
MARKIRIEYAEAAYHVMARGNQGRAIYADERDRKLRLALPGPGQPVSVWRLQLPRGGCTGDAVAQGRGDADLDHPVTV